MQVQSGAVQARGRMRTGREGCSSGARQAIVFIGGKVGWTYSWFFSDSAWVSHPCSAVGGKRWKKCENSSSLASILIFLE